MAVGTVASRATGFLRTAILAAVFGVKGVAVAFNVANTAPNIVYDLLLGGILTSVVVPMLVRADKQGNGEAYVQRLLTLTLLVLGSVSLVLVLLAPQIVDLYVSSKVDADTRQLAVTFARFFLPQVLFYGLGAVLGAYLNTRDRFGPPMWAPVLNNVVVIVTLLLFAFLPGPAQLTSATITQTQVVVVGIGVTLGVVAQTLALLPALRATGLHLRLRFDLRGTGLGHAARLARWTFFYVLCNQLVFVVVVQLATSTGRVDDYPSFTYAYLLWQLPHAVVAVSVITALLPSMSRAAADGRLLELRHLLDRGLRVTVSILVPASAAYIVLGQPLASLVFGHGRVATGEARFIGTLLAVFACGLLAFSAYQLQLRAFYALQDTRTPAVINLTVNLATVVVDVLLFVTLPNHLKIVGLAAGQTASYLVGSVICTRVLARRVPRDRHGFVLRTTVRCLFAALPPALGALAVVAVVDRVVGMGTSGAFLASAGGGAVLLTGYLALARQLRVPEVDRLLEPVLARLGR
ncbi:MAG: integral rane protein MviN [Frankiales bacterium]|nr:integral rane protein MviN [Frankiales bacterium]